MKLDFTVLRQLLLLTCIPTILSAQLVSHGDSWNYRKGTSEPPADWHSVDDASLDASWFSGPGGFGYDDGDDATVLSDMLNSYLTVYIRKSFDVTAGMDPASILRLTIDYDDAYVVYLDGVEISRSSNAGGTAGTPIPFDPTPLSASHEASAGAGGAAPTVLNLGTLGSLLNAGTHILAVQGINQQLSSSDFSLIVDLDLVAPPAPVTWALADSPVNLTSNFIVDGGVTLTIEAGVEVNLSSGVSILAINGSHIDVAGTAAAPVVFKRSGASEWGEISATGTGGSLTIRHADISGGEVRFLTGVTGLAENCRIHDSSASAMVFSNFAAAVRMYRCEMFDYGETNFKSTLIVLEECLFEAASADAVDFDAAPPGSAIRRCTFRNGPGGSNTDAIDLGPNAGVPSRSVVIEDCLMFNFSDKGVSIGDGPDDAEDILVRNCLIYDVAKGVQVKHGGEVHVQGCTIVDTDIALHGFEKAGGTGGGILNDCYDNILSNNVAEIVLEPSSVLEISYSNTNGSVWPGTGNINANPLFRNAAARDYRLLSGSPSIGTGKTGGNMGVRYPVGGLPGIPGNARVLSFDGSQALLSWTDPDDMESSFVIEQSSDGSLWTEAATAPADATGVMVTGLDTISPWQFRMRGTNFIGDSLNSEHAFAIYTPGDRDSDGMPDAWEEMFAGLNPDHPDDAATDIDNDGTTNLEEYTAGTDPTDQGSVLKLESLTRANGVVDVQFIAQPDKSYTVQYSRNLEAGSWQMLADIPADPALRPAVVVSDTSGVTIRFYRLVTPAVP
jgi:hypothetical protein